MATKKDETESGKDPYVGAVADIEGAAKGFIQAMDDRGTVTADDAEAVSLRNTVERFNTLEQNRADVVGSSRALLVAFESGPVSADAREVANLKKVL